MTVFMFGCPATSSGMNSQQLLLCVFYSSSCSKLMRERKEKSILSKLTIKYTMKYSEIILMK